MGRPLALGVIDTLEKLDLPDAAACLKDVVEASLANLELFRELQSGADNVSWRASLRGRTWPCENPATVSRREGIPEAGVRDRAAIE